MTKYVAEATAARFHADKESKVKLLMSAVGQGKTVACIQEMLMVGIQQAPDARGVRRTRWAVIRSTFGQLKTTTIQTFKEWIPETLCKIVYDSPIRAHIKEYPLDDGTFLDIEFWFMPLDSPEALANLLGSELTGAYINELPEIRNANLVQDVFKRCGRYPPKKDGAAITWRGVIADYNPPPRKSWLHVATEVDPIPGWKLYRIPAPILVTRDEDDPDNMDKVHFVPNPDAENVQHQPLGIDYWIDMAEQGKKTDWEGVRRFALGDYPNGVGGRAIFPLFSHAQHTVRNGLVPNRGSVLFVGLDLGLCVDDQTEVLTWDGFKYFKDVTMQDEMATRNPANGQLEYHKPNFLVDEAHDGPMLTFENRTVNFCVTPEHRVPVYRRNSSGEVLIDSFEFISAQEAYDSRSHLFVDLCAKWEGKEPESVMGYDPEWFAWFMGIFLSDGSISRESKNSYRIQIAQTKRAHRAAIEDRIIDDTWSIAEKYYRTSRHQKLAKYLYELGRLKQERSIPKEIMQMSPRLLKVFIDGFTTGDGHIRKRQNDSTEHTICTAHEHIARQLQEIALKIGWHSSSTTQDQRGKISTFEDGRRVVSNSVMHTVAFKKRAVHSNLRATKKSTHHYTGRRYCVNVPHHTLFIRRKGKTSWTGNTPAAAFMQFVDGTVQQTDEITTRDASLTELIEDDLIPLIRERYMGYKIIVVGDPTGGGRSQYDKTTPYRLFSKYGIKYVVPKGKNEFPVRRDATNKYLKRRNGYIIDEERCPDTVSAFLGNYQWDDSRVGASNQKPKKHGEEGWYSHIMDAAMGVFVYFEQGAEVYSDVIDHHGNFDSMMMATPPSATQRRSEEAYFYA